MSMQVESANCLHKFVNFAKLHENNGDAIARFAENDPDLRTIVATDRDHIRGVLNWKWHGAENAAANNQIRQQFILNVLKCLGWNPAQNDDGHALTQAEITEAVNTLFPGQRNNERRTALLKALKVKDYGCGKPLTSRRINATIAQVKAIVERSPVNPTWEDRRQTLILKELTPDALGGDEAPAGTNVSRNRNLPPSGSNRIEFGNPVVGFEAEEVPEELNFQGVEDVIGGGIRGGGVDDDDIKDLVDSMKEVPGKKVRSATEILEAVFEEFWSRSDIVDKILNKDYDGQGGKSVRISTRMLSAITAALIRGTRDDFNVDLDDVVRKMYRLKAFVTDEGATQRCGEGCGTDKKIDGKVLRQVLRDLFTDYNKWQKNESLRVVIPEG